MAELNARNDSFISMLLEVSGRARPSDLHSVPASEAAALLGAYRAAHPEMQLVFEDDTLVHRPAGAAPQPSVPQVAPQPVAPQPVAPPPVTTPPVAPPQVAPANPEPVAPVPVAPAPATPTTTVWDFTTPESVTEVPAPSAVAPASEDVPAENLPSWVYQEQAGVDTDLTGFSAPPPPSDYAPAIEDFEQYPAYEPVAPAEARIPLWKWLLSALLPLLGFLWYFELRSVDPQGAKRLLAFTLAATVVLIALLVAFVFLFGPTLLAAFPA